MDGTPDLLVLFDSNTIAYSLQSANGFAAFTTQSLEYFPPGSTFYHDRSMALADLNHDGCPDAVVADGLHALRVFSGRGCQRHVPGPSTPLPPPVAAD